jgi:cell division septation protein DedD
VQLGAFKSRPNAEALLARAQAAFADATISSVESEGAPVFRVLSGSFADKADADARARALAQSGFTTYVRTVLP